MKGKIISLFIIFLFSFIFSNAHGASQDETKINEYLKVIEIDEDVFRVIHKFPWSANSLLVRCGENEFVLCDTPIENSGSQALVEWMRDKYGDVKLTVVNCHYHIDCLGGNHYMLSQGFPVYATEMTLNMFEEDKDNIIPRMLRGTTDSKMINVIKNLKLASPDNIFDENEGLILKIGEEEIELYYPGGGHTEDNIVVYFPKRKILYGGCLVKAFEQTNLGRQSFANFEAWPQSLQNLLDKFPDAEIVVPGHGAHGDMSMVNHTIDLLKQN
ncbi:MBL fold metallo-hydrolase [Bacteroidota bacterium]